MGQLTQTTAQLQVIIDDADDANVGKTSLTDGSDTTAVAFKKSGFYSLQGSSANAPSTDRAVLISAVRNTAATGEIRYGQIAITESNGLWWNRDDGGSLGTWYEAVTTASAQTLTNKTLTSPVLTTPQINDSAADHQYIFAGSNLTADRTVTLPLLTGDDTFVFAAHTQTLTNKTLTTPTVSGLTLSDASIIFEGATANAHETTLTVTDPTADRTITLPDATDTLVGRATTDTLTNKTLTSPVASGLTLSDASIVFEGATADAHETTLTVADPTADRTITLPNATDTLVGLATTDTLTNKTLTSPVFNTGVSGTAVLDADDFTGASATTLASSESIKAYVDGQIAATNELSEVLAAGNTTGSTDIEVTAAQKVQFRDSAIYINSSADGQLDIVADTEIQIAATTVDLNGNLDVSGTASAANVSLPDDGVLSLGTSDELTLKHHNSGYSHLINTTGTLYIDSDSVTFRDDDGSPSNMVVSQTGIDVTGTVTADGLTVSASATDFEGVQILNTNTAASPTTASILLGVTNSVRTVNTKIQAIEGGGDANETSLAFFTNTGGNVLTKAMTIDSFQNVGIGTSSVATKLHVMGNSTVRNTIVSTLTLDAGISAANPYTEFGTGIDFKGRDYSNAVRNYGGIYSIMVGNASSTTPAGDAGFNSALTFYTNTGGASGTNPTEKMRIDPTGVGIGSIAPFAPLHLKNTSWSSGSPYGTVQLIEGQAVNDHNWSHLVITDADDTNGNGGSISFASGAASSLNPFASIKGYREGSGYGSLDFYTRPSGGTATQRMRISSAGLVGIGTTDMQNQLNVGGAASGDSAIYILGSRGSADNLAAGNLTFRNVSNGTGDVNLTRIQTLTGTGSSQSQKGQLTFSTNNGSGLVERIRIAADGSLSTPTAGISNVRFGVNAGNSIASGGNYNVVVGDEAGTAISTGDANVAVGFRALDAEVTGSTSVAVGAWALSAQANSGNAYNTAVGYLAGEKIEGGANNTIVGALAGDAITTGARNTIIGYNNDANAVGGQDQVVIGNNTTGAGNDSAAIGGDLGRCFITLDGSDTSWGADSDERLKKDIRDATAGLSFINDLRPVTYKWKAKNEIDSSFPRYDADSSKPVNGKDLTYHGFIAQEIKASIDRSSDIPDGQHFWGEDSSGVQNVSPGDLIPILVKAIQELTARIEALES